MNWFKVNIVLLLILLLLLIAAVTQTCSVKKMFLEILQNSQENICARVSIETLG